MIKSLTRICSVLFGIHIATIIFNGTQYFTIGNRSILYSIIILFSSFDLLNNILHGHKKIKFNLFSVSFLSISMIIYTLLSAFFIVDDFQSDVLLASLLFYCLILVWSNINFKRNDILFIKNSYSYSALMISITLIFFGIQPYPGLSRMSITSYTGDFYDVNFLAAFILIPTIYLIADLMESSKHVFFKIAKVLICCVAIVLTGSRSALFLMTLSFFALLWIRKKMDLRFLCFAIIITIVLATAVPFIPLDILEHYNRGFNPLEDQRRMLDWMTGFSLIEKRPLWGNGLVSTNELIIREYATPWVTVHNSFIVFLVQYGLFFGIIAISAFLLVLLRLYNNKFSKIHFIACLSYIGSILIIESNFSDIMIIPLLFFIANANYENSNAKLIERYVSS